MDQITLRGSFTASKFSKKDEEMLDFLATTKMEYHTITLGYSHSSMVPKLSVLLTSCKDHLETLFFTALERNPRPLYGKSSFCLWLLPDWTNETRVGDFHPGFILNLSLCKKLVEIQAPFNHAHFERITPILKSVASHRFRKLEEIGRGSDRAGGTGECHGCD